MAFFSFACKPHVLVVGLDGANWKVLNPLIDAGLIPNIGDLVRNGASADLDCVPAHPSFACFCPPVWTTVATGVPFADHQIGGRYTPSVARRTKAIWNVVDEFGGVVTTSSWRGSWPPEPGVDFVFTEPGLDAAAESRYAVWLRPKRHPAFEQPDPLFAPSDILELLDLGPRPEGPPLMAIYGRDRVAMESLLRLSEARELLRAEEEPWERRTELTMITIHGPDKVAHVAWGLVQQVMFGPFDEEALLADADQWSGPIEAPGPWGWGALAGPYLEADAWLGRMLAVHEYDYVVFVSDHGMTRNPEAGLAGHHSTSSTEAHVGIFSLTGPGVRPGAWLGKISVLDVAPTLAYVLELPVADALPGRVLAEAFTDDWVFWKPVDRLTTPSWEDPRGS